ncbi:MAG: AAA family ATPase, partial [Betaproteobacteria bacterium]|nr:AAA family ATPase [Betaproteobacteria bacterium]
DLLHGLTHSMSAADLIELQQRAQKVHASSALLDYVQALVTHTRHAVDYVNGLSPRAALALLHAARAWALMSGRGHVVPEDVQAVLPGVVGHRLVSTGEVSRVASNDTAAHLVKQVTIP